VFLILGLGNPGPKYQFTRHNVGFMAVDALADAHGIRLSKHDQNSLFGQGKIGDETVILAKPMTYMNESGLAAMALLRKYHLQVDRMIVLHDEIDLPLGTVKLKRKGGDAGQKGVRSIIQRTGEDEFARIRIGIGRPLDKQDIADYVLSSFEIDERGALGEILEQASIKAEEILKETH
jgi:peptidyl-tRNA hydrolase, PTH1 family